MPSTQGSPQNTNRDQKSVRDTRKVFPGVLPVGVILLTVALLMFVYVITYRPGWERREFAGRIDHPPTQSVESPSPRDQSSPPGEHNRNQQHHSTPQTRNFQHATQEMRLPVRILQPEVQDALDTRVNPSTATPSLPQPFSLQIVNSPSQGQSAKSAPTPTSVAPCVAPSTKVTTHKKANFFRWVWGIVKKVFGGGEQAKSSPPNGPPIICSLTASSSTLTLPCAEGASSESCQPSVSRTVDLTVEAADGDNDTLRYTWTVTAGKPLGEGRKIIWDLSGAEPGTYTATVEITDGNKHTASSSTTVIIAKCPRCLPPCPTSSVSCPSDVDVGSPITFTASVSGDASLTYNWSVSAGMIRSGQGTSSITVDTAGLSGQTVTATVELGGLDPSCSRTASCTTGIRALLANFRKFDEYGNIRFDDERARLANFATQLRTEPGSQGAIITYGSCEGEGLAHAARSQAYLVNNLGIDRERITIVDGGCRNELAMELWVVPAGAEMPGPNTDGAVSPCPACRRKPPPRGHATLAGVVQGPGGETIAGAKVVAYGEDGSVKEATSDQNGDFAFNDLKTGTYRLEVSAPGFGKVTVPDVEVKEGENSLPRDFIKVSREARLQKRHATLAGVIQGPGGETIAGAKVVAYGEGGSVKNASTDQNGNFAFNDLVAGTYRLEISAPGFGKLTVTDVKVKEGDNFLPRDLLKVSRAARTMKLSEQDVIRVEYPDHFLRDPPGEVEFTLDRQLGEVVPSETNTNGRIEITEKAPPVPGATPGLPYIEAQGGGYTAYATVSLIPTGLTQVEGPAVPEQSLNKAPVSWKWKLKPANDVGKVGSFRFHVDLVWRGQGLPTKYFSYDWPKEFSVAIGPPPSVVAAEYGYRGFGAGGLGMLGLGIFRRRRTLIGDEAEEAALAGDATGAGIISGETAEEVSSSVFAPRQAAPGDSFLVQVFAHLPEVSPESLKAKATEADPDADQVGAEPLEQPIKRGASLSFRLSMEGLNIDEPQQTRVWKGQTICVQFGVSVPQDAAPRTMFGLVVVCEDSLPVGHFRFTFKIVSPASGKIDVPIKVDAVSQYKTAFISYAHEDRAEVLKRVQMLSLLRQKYFQDFINLKPGDKWEPAIYEYIDKSDVVYLFWSTAASKSEWVKKEILRAVKRHAGQDDAAPVIYPVIIEGPPPAKPPEELSFLHFDDEFAYWIFAAKATSKH